MTIHYIKLENGFVDAAFSQHQLHTTIKMPHAYLIDWMKDYPMIAGVTLDDQVKWFIEHNFNLNLILS